ncbi:hypothetical protein CC78DRAFT_577301 [Lojkania enalia]|uniref:Uncharacterized protein n=1 Tax=Lojkania enalia TaxID=147567 RepID=A0A9P4N6D6_9PLEO|nr:hypothetical protein CC78DRAFT_577301 [Didymosphaeria enalia]
MSTSITIPSTASAITASRSSSAMLSSPPTDKEAELSTGAIAGIVVAGTFVICLVATIVILLLRRARRHRRWREEKEQNLAAGYNTLDSNTELGSQRKAINLLPPTQKHLAAGTNPQTRANLGGELGRQLSPRFDRIPVRQLDSNEQPRLTPRLPSQDQEANELEGSHTRKPTLSMIYEINTSTGVSRRESMKSHNRRDTITVHGTEFAMFRPRDSVAVANQSSEPQLLSPTPSIAGPSENATITSENIH